MKEHTGIRKGYRNNDHRQPYHLIQFQVGYILVHELTSISNLLKHFYEQRTLAVFYSFILRSRV